MKYFYNKPENIGQESQLFAEDLNSSGAKKFFFSDHTSIFYTIANSTKTLNLYEDHTYSKLIKLHFDIDFVNSYQHYIYKKEDANKILNELIPQIINKIKNQFDNYESKYIVWMSNGLQKLSLHIILLYKGIYKTY